MGLTPGGRNDDRALKLARARFKPWANDPPPFAICETRKKQVYARV
jgi:hypothetical protein